MVLGGGGCWKGGGKERKCVAAGGWIRKGEGMRENVQKGEGRRGWKSFEESVGWLEEK